MPNPPKKIEEELKELKKRVAELEQAELAQYYLAALVESADDAIIGKTIDGTIISWNKGAEKIYGYTAEEVLGHSISLLIPPGHPDELPAIMTRLRVPSRRWLQRDGVERPAVRRPAHATRVALPPCADR